MVILGDIFTMKHFSGLLYVVLLGVFTFLILSRNNVKGKQFALIFMVIFYVLEVLKIGYLWIGSSFPMNHLPFHLCSMPLYLFPIYYFSKEGSKLERIAQSGIYGVVFMAGFVALVMPTNIIGNEPNWSLVRGNFLPLVSFTYHGFMMIAPIYMIVNKLYDFQYKDYFYAVLCALGLMVLAVTANGLLDKDYMLLNYGNGSPFQFLLETSKLVYMMSMVILGFFIIHINYFVTMVVVDLQIKFKRKLA